MTLKEMVILLEKKGKSINLSYTASTTCLSRVICGEDTLLFIRIVVPVRRRDPASVDPARRTNNLRYFIAGGLFLPITRERYARIIVRPPINRQMRLLFIQNAADLSRIVFHRFLCVKREPKSCFIGPTAGLFLRYRPPNSSNR
jgi:hypothetical protein